MKPPSPVDGQTMPATGAERTAPAPIDPPSSAADRDAVDGSAAPRSWRDRFGRPARGPLLMGFCAALLLVIGGFGAGGVLVHDPVLTNSPLGFWRYGHGREVASFLMYSGVALMTWAWILLGREVLAQRARGRAVLTTAFVWTLPMLFAPPLFTRDIFSYLAQGGLPLAGFDPYAVGPEALPGIFADNVHYFWQDTPAPYGPLFILLAKAVAWVTGDTIILGVVLMRLALLPGLLLFIWALPELTRRLGGRVPVALWVAVANPVMVVHMVGGGHNDLLVVGLLAAAALVALRGGHVSGIALATAAMAVKASAAIALPFLVLIWAAHLAGTQRARITKAIAAGGAVFLVVFTACTLAAQVGLGWLPALSAPSMIVNWMSLPTAVGEFTHSLISLIVSVPKQPFINVARVLGGIVLVYIAVRQWWAARDGGPEAIRRAGIVLLAVAVLSPAMLPWYVSWGMALIAGAAWSVRGLQFTVFVSVMLTICYYSNGEDALYNPPYLLAWALVALLASVSLVRPDPLRLAPGAWRRPPDATATPASAPAPTQTQTSTSTSTPTRSPSPSPRPRPAPSADAVTPAVPAASSAGAEPGPS